MSYLPLEIPSVLIYLIIPATVFIQSCTLSIRTEGVLHILRQEKH